MQEKKTNIVMFCIFICLTVFLAIWFYINYISSWYNATYCHQYIPIDAKVISVETNAVKANQSSVISYLSYCNVEYTNSINKQIETRVNVPNNNLKNISKINDYLDSIYYKGKLLKIFVNPVNQKDVIINYKNAETTNWFKITIGTIMFLIVWGPCLVLSIVAFKGLIKLNKDSHVEI